MSGVTINSPSRKLSGDQYWNYCEHSSINYVGEGRLVSPDFNTCNVSPSCSLGYSNTTTIEQSFSISVGISAGLANEDLASEASVSVDASWEWSMSQATSITAEITISEGKLVTVDTEICL